MQHNSSIVRKQACFENFLLFKDVAQISELTNFSKLAYPWRIEGKLLDLEPPSISIFSDKR